MANRAHLDKLIKCITLGKEGIVQWNQWRKEHPDIHPDLSDIDLSCRDLSDADLSHVDLSLARLNDTNFKGANLNDSDLRFAELKNADLRNTDLGLGRLSYADLSGADLRGASLKHANINRANLYQTDMDAAIIGETQLDDLDLSLVKGLENIRHEGPSSIDIRTLYRSHGNIPEAFLKGAGVDDNFIQYIRSLTQKPFEYYSCFISYSSKDTTFAERLYADLQAKNVRCWFAPHDMRTGDPIRDRIDESIRLYEKLPLILSYDSVESHWVKHEVETALDKEREGHPNVLFPVRIDDTILSKKIGWANHIRTTRHIGDFTQWRQHDAYQLAFTRLLRDLKAQS